MRATLGLILAGVASQAWPLAAGASGCDAFKWPIAAEAAALSASSIPALEPGAALSYGAAARLQLVPLEEAKLPLAPERAPKVSPSYAGAFPLAAPAAPGTYKITLSGPGWIDVVQNGKFVHPTGFGDPSDCPGARKSLKFPLADQPATLQLSGVGDREISAIVTPE
ncbi:MAG: hypothetical protein E7774_07575 [Bradyrhizobium sp.]|nr:MAG: hypothetical protein E7774_07575 [Bradyrhizobium sp.]